jgi:hypothetical protein
MINCSRTCCEGLPANPSVASFFSSHGLVITMLSSHCLLILLFLSWYNLKYVSPVDPNLYWKMSQGLLLACNFSFYQVCFLVNLKLALILLWKLELIWDKRCLHPKNFYIYFDINWHKATVHMCGCSVLFGYMCTCGMIKSGCLYTHLLKHLAFLCGGKTQNHLFYLFRHVECNIVNSSHLFCNTKQGFIPAI